MKKFFRVLLVVFAIYAIVMAAMAVQYFFDRGDLRKASAVIYEFKPDKTKDETLAALMAAEQKILPTELACDAQIMSRYEGQVLVTCDKYEWMVDVVASRIYPKNEVAQKLMTAIAP